MEYLVWSYIHEILSPILFGMKLIYNMKLGDLCENSYLFYFILGEKPLLVPTFLGDFHFSP